MNDKMIRHNLYLKFLLEHIDSSLIDLLLNLENTIDKILHVDTFNINSVNEYSLNEIIELVDYFFKNNYPDIDNRFQSFLSSKNLRVINERDRHELNTFLAKRLAFYYKNNKYNAFNKLKCDLNELRINGDYLSEELNDLIRDNDIGMVNPLKVKKLAKNGTTFHYVIKDYHNPNSNIVTVTNLDNYHMIRSLIHEFIHYDNHVKKENNNYSLVGEFPSTFMELDGINYLYKEGILSSNDYYSYLNVRINNIKYTCLPIKFILILIRLNKNNNANLEALLKELRNQGNIYNDLYDIFFKVDSDMYHIHIFKSMINYLISSILSIYTFSLVESGVIDRSLVSYINSNINDLNYEELFSILGINDVSVLDNSIDYFISDISLNRLQNKRTMRVKTW